MIGQTNTFANKIGVSSPAMNNMSNNLQQMADLIDV
jgi:DNA-binding transcriptional regulator YdaS (Cro superfamily)